MRGWTRALTVDFSRNWKRLTWDLHNATGFWILALLMIWALSGIYFVFPSEFRSLVSAVSPVSSPAVRVSSNPALKGSGEVPAIRTLIEKARQQWPEADGVNRMPCRRTTKPH